MFKPYMASIQD